MKRTLLVLVSWLVLWVGTQMPTAVAQTEPFDADAEESEERELETDRVAKALLEK